MFDYILYSYVNPWRHAFDFKGVTSRIDYWSFIFIQLSIFFIGAKSLEALPANPEWIRKIFLYPFLLWMVGSVFVTMSCQVRRLRDATGSGWLWFLHLVPYLGTFVTFLMTLLPTKGSISLPSRF
ncbi:MAG: hypothetical protein CMM03_03920 [Rhodopirellula sp.]|nr:hypothetical protein [Rhodopirellula sp.]